MAICATAPDLEPTPPPAAPKGATRLLIDSGAAAHVTTIKTHTGPVRSPDGRVGRPCALRDGGMGIHKSEGVTNTTMTHAKTGARFTIENDNRVPTFGIPVLSLGELVREGYRHQLDRPPFCLWTPGGTQLPVTTHDNLYFMDVYPDNIKPTADMAAGVPHLPATAREPRMELFEPYAGRAMMARAARDLGMDVVAVGEIDIEANHLLLKDFPHAQVMRDAADGEWRTVQFTRDAWKIIAAGIPCQACAPTGLRRLWDDPRAEEIRRFVQMVECHRPHLAIIENVYAFALTMMGEFDKMMHSIGYAPVLPNGVPHVEFLRATDHHSAWWRDRIHRLYEPIKLTRLLPPLPAPPPAEIHDRPRTMGEYLLAAPEVPDWTFIHGDFKRLAKPRRSKPDDPLSPLVIAELIVQPRHPVARHSLVRLKGDDGTWVVLGIHEHTVDLIRNERERPRRLTVPRRDVATHVQHTLPVHSPQSTLISPN